MRTLFDDASDPASDSPQHERGNVSSRDIQAVSEGAVMNRTEALAGFFALRPNQWVDGRSLSFAGSYAWRTRISDLRKPPYGMQIENRQRRMSRPDGSRYTISEYRYVPAAALQARA
jgi:hypothetical protein